MFIKKLIGTFGVVLVSTAYLNTALADTYGGYAKVEIITIEKNQSQNNDISIQAKFTGKGGPMNADEEKMLVVRESDFGLSGVNRIQSLALAALLAGKQLWLKFELPERTASQGHLLRIDVRQ